MKEEAFLEPLVLKQKPRLAIQLITSVVLIVTAVTAFYQTEDIVDNLEPKVDESVKKPKLWFTITMCVVAFIPAVFLFNLINNNLDLTFEAPKEVVN